MSKNKTLSLSVIAALISTACLLLFSCKDETGKFIGQLYTDAQKQQAVKACLTASCDTALNRLCTYDGFYGGDARIDFAALPGGITDTLTAHNYGYLIDSLILSTNRIAEGCGVQISPYFKKAIDTLDYSPAAILISGADNAITKYYENNEREYLRNTVKVPMGLRMNLFGVNDLWNEIVAKYYEYAKVPVSFDIQDYVVNKMLSVIFAEMEKEEYMIRTDEGHRNDDMMIFGEENIN